MSKVENGSFVVLQGWMISELHLKGNELITFAIIYGFSHLEGQRFNGSLQYIADWTNSSKESIRKCLNSLRQKGLIVKYDKYVNNFKLCEYSISQTVRYAVRGYTTKLDGGIQQSCIGYTTKLDGGIQQSCINNIKDNIKDNIDNMSNSNAQKKRDSDFEELWAIYPKKEGKKAAHAAFLRAVKSGTTKEQIKNGIERYVKYIKLSETPSRFIKHGSTFFNQECWNDEFNVEGVVKNGRNSTDFSGQDWSASDDPTVV